MTSCADTGRGPRRRRRGLSACIAGALAAAMVGGGDLPAGATPAGGEATGTPVAAVDPPAAPAPATAPVRAGRVCLGGRRVADLDRLFHAEPGGVIGADYQRAHPLPDGRVLWLFQDAAVRLSQGGFTIVHNIAIIQDGSCFDVIRGGTSAAPAPFLFAAATVPFQRWFWPLDAELGSDGRLYVFVAEMVERDAGYLRSTEPVGTYVAAFDPATDTIAWEGRPGNPSAALYGWSITSDSQWTYLYAHCYRQFGYDDFLGIAAFDRSCANRITVGRVPRGDVLRAPEYWDGTRWQPDPAQATPVIATAGRRVNADQIEWIAGSFYSVNKEGDWWGDTIYFSRAGRATGPFETYDTMPAPTKCPVCNSFFATWIPRAAVDRAPGTFVIGLSHNRWDGITSAWYRPTFHEVRAPPYLAARTTLRVLVPGAGGGGVGAVVLDVAAVDPAGPGFVTAFPCDRERPLASNLNYGRGQVVANLVVVRPDRAGEVCLYSLAATDLVVDLAGSFVAGGDFTALDNPARIADTRVGGAAGRVGAGGTLRVVVPGAAGGGVGAVVLDVAAVDPAGPGFVTAFPCDRERPLASNLNYGRGQVVANLVVVRPDRAGEVCLYSLAATDLVVDLAGSFVAGGDLTALDNPTRITDTRTLR